MYTRILTIALSSLLVCSLGLSAQQQPAVTAADATGKQTDKEQYNEPYRPQLHFSPVAHWMNDPNGMVYAGGVYNLFYQYYPGATVWGPMHWGHASSTDLVHWKQLPVALYPDSLGYIFSGSAVVDSTNTSGFGRDGKIPLVAIFTHHDPKGEKAGTNNYQNESIAYSLDQGLTWTKYAANPVLKNPGLTDFRDPKVFWYAPARKWIMTLATKSDISFYASPNLKDWTKQSEFGTGLGAHGGVWECPDLFQLSLDGRSTWVLIVNLNPGGPNGGSGTQYFTGSFDGVSFTPASTETRWLDYGPDEYAGVTWSNTGKRKIFLGWMSNWLYANLVPTDKWRNAMTVPRELALQRADGKVMLTSSPVKELNMLKRDSIVGKDLSIHAGMNLTKDLPVHTGQYEVKLSTARLATYSVTLSNDSGEELSLGYDNDKKGYYINRLHSGESAFSKSFAGVFTAPRLTADSAHDLTLIVDEASVELFADRGLTAMTATFFPKTPFTHISVRAEKPLELSRFSITTLKSIWK